MKLFVVQISKTFPPLVNTQVNKNVHKCVFCDRPVRSKSRSTSLDDISVILWCMALELGTYLITYTGTMFIAAPSESLFGP